MHRSACTRRPPTPSLERHPDENAPGFYPPGQRAAAFGSGGLPGGADVAAAPAGWGDFRPSRQPRLPPRRGKRDTHRPQLLILIHGGNDLLRGRGGAELARNLRAMVEAARARGIAVGLVGVPGPGLLLRGPEPHWATARSSRTPSIPTPRDTASSRSASRRCSGTPARCDLFFGFTGVDAEQCP